MKLEEIGKCPCCFEKGSYGAIVDFFVVREDNGDLKEIHIVGDDLDIPSRDWVVTEATTSKDGKSVTEIVCPRCKEHINVNISIIKQQDKMFQALPAGAKPLTVARTKSENLQEQKQAD